MSLCFVHHKVNGSTLGRVICQLTNTFYIEWFVEAQLCGIKSKHKGTPIKLKDVVFIITYLKSNKIQVT